MNFNKIINVINNRGQADYKGLNIDLFIGALQVYPCNLQENNMCLIATTDEEIKESLDIQLLTEEEYNTLKQEILSAYPPTPPSAEERFALLEQAMNGMLLGGV